MNDNFTISKTTAECYKIRPAKDKTHCAWADITIDSGDRSGRIQIASDFGDWQYYWGASGPFKKFLAQINMDYAAGKFGCDRHFDQNATVKEFKAYLIDLRRAGDLDAEQAREIWDEIKKADEASSIEEFNEVLWNGGKIVSLFDGIPSVQFTVKPLFVRFWKEIWPVLLAEFKKEELEKVMA